MWLGLALLSALFAALTSILAKVGIEGVNSNLATAIRTGVVLLMAWGMVFSDQCAGRHSRHQHQKLAVFDPLWTGHRSILAVLL